jgi:hypothetical protein
MQYKVLPFVAKISNTGGSSDAADALQVLINTEAAGGWTYMHMDNITTHVAGSDGCFGFGATPAGMASYSVVVFSK